MEHGQTHVYYGGGKGKTTAAIGLAVRAIGAGKKVYMGQFIKDMEYSEISILRSLPGMTVELYGTGKGCFISRNPDPSDLYAAAEGIRKARAAMACGKYDLVILDEINVACSLHLITPKNMTDLMDAKPENVELILTGRGCPQEALERADLVTEMREVRHYYATKGLLSRVGIER